MIPALVLCAAVASAQSSDPADRHYLLSVVPLIQRNDLAGAEQRLIEGLRQYPESAVLENALGLTYEKQGKQDAAVSAYETALRRLPSFTAAQLHLAPLYRQRGRLKDAADLYAAAGQGTNDPGAVTAAALGLGECEDWARAVPLFEKARRLSPDSSSAAYNLALALYKDREYQQALDALESQPAQADVLHLRGKIHEALGQPAGEELAAACRAEPASPAFCVDAGVRLLRDQQFTTAVELLESAAGAAAPSVPLLTALGLAQFRVGRYKEAIASYQRALDAAPALDAAREGLVFLLYMTGDLDRARAVAEQGLQHPDADAYLWQLEAMILYRQSPQSADQALAAVNRALQKNPQFAGAYFLRGKIEAAQGSSAIALADFQRAAALDPNYPLPYYKMAQIYLRQGRTQEAEQARLRFRQLGSLREEEMLARQAQDLLMPAAR